MVPSQEYCLSKSGTRTTRLWQPDDFPRVPVLLIAMLSRVIMTIVMLQSFSCVVVRVAAQPSLDPTEGTPPLTPPLTPPN